MYCATYDSLAQLQLSQSLHNPGTSPGSTDQRERVPDIQTTEENVTSDTQNQLISGRM